MPNSAATFSPVSGMESTPYCCFISGLMKRQPMVVSKISALREKAVSAFGITKGARDMDSTPPAMIRSASPERMARAPAITASIPEPHRRLMVVPDTLAGQAGEKQRHASDVAIVFACLVGAAEYHVIHGFADRSSETAP